MRECTGIASEFASNNVRAPPMSRSRTGWLGSQVNERLCVIIVEHQIAIGSWRRTSICVLGETTYARASKLLHAADRDQSAQAENPGDLSQHRGVRPGDLRGASRKPVLFQQGFVASVELGGRIAGGHPADPNRLHVDRPSEYVRERQLWIREQMQRLYREHVRNGAPDRIQTSDPCLRRVKGRRVTACF